MEHSIGKTDGTNVNRLPGLEERAGLEAGALSKAASSNPNEIADAIVSMDVLAKEVIENGTTKSVSQNKTLSWKEGVKIPERGIGVYRFDGKIQSVQPMTRQKFNREGVSIP